LTIKSTSNTNYLKMSFLRLASAQQFLRTCRPEAALLVIYKIMPVRYSVVKDQTSSLLKTSKIAFPIHSEKPPSNSSLPLLPAGSVGGPG
jgi:hypothetical protein